MDARSASNLVCDYDIIALEPGEENAPPPYAFCSHKPKQIIQQILSPNFTQKPLSEPPIHYKLITFNQCINGKLPNY